MPSNHTVRIRSAGHYASGLLISEEHLNLALDSQSEMPAEKTITARATHILTVDHFLRECGSVINIKGRNFSATASTSLSVFGTDLGLIKINGRAPTNALPCLATAWIFSGQKTTTYGFGGQPGARSAQAKPGRVIAPIPLSISRNRITRVTHGALIYNAPLKAIKGDSGGPVLIDGLVVGVQSMITDPGGFNTGIATIATLHEHFEALAQAMNSL